ncbi:DNA-binding MarR family transcriptional regulator [Conyzicola lurida]|uniref:DNA-binding MarR family transcriptional regulator n=1 Tax=Conyzicola lurida TaxID=1172621 RepID=A0A841AKM0_9MICO|nr:crosslink repair DNA glycosylase YcaQ family protein [Conyzicola lurida]MBB5841999.1 DNA-binding MarR family transcriptional regulator [Conyzicola lurida]
MPDSRESDAAREAFALDIEEGVAGLYRASKARVKRLVEHLDPDMQTAGYLVLRYVMAHGPIRAGDIAAGLTMDKSAVSRQLTVLRDSGLIEARPDPEDGRASLVVASEKANERLDEFRVDLKADYQRILASWDAADIEAFARLLGKFNESR